MRHVGAHVSIAGGVQNAITNTVSIGASCLQIFAGSPRLWLRKPFPDKEVGDFKDARLEHGIGPVFIHALYLVNLATPNKEMFEKSIASLKMDMQNGSLINSSGVIVHIGSHLGSGFDAVKDQLVRAIKRLLADTSGCDLILENTAGQKGKIGSLPELSWLIGEVNDKRLKICLDSAHLYASGIDLKKQAVVDNLVKELKELRLLDRLVCLHVNDCASTLGSHRDIHANLGEGEIGMDGLKLLVNHDLLLHLPIILEVPGTKGMPDKDQITKAKSL